MAAPASSTRPTTSQAASAAAATPPAPSPPFVPGAERHRPVAVAASPKASRQRRQTGSSSQSPAFTTSRVANAAHAVVAVSTAASTKTTMSGSRSATRASTRTTALTTNAVPATQPGVNHGAASAGHGAAALRALAAASRAMSKFSRSKSSGARERPVTRPAAMSSGTPAGWWPMGRKVRFGASSSSGSYRVAPSREPGLLGAAPSVPRPSARRPRLLAACLVLRASSSGLVRGLVALGGLARRLLVLPRVLVGPSARRGPSSGGSGGGDSSSRSRLLRWRPPFSACGSGSAFVTSPVLSWSVPRWDKDAVLSA